MTEQEIWSAYTRQHPEAAEKGYQAWRYGSDDPDELARLTVAGVKTATAGAYALYEAEGEALPQTGELNIIMYTDGSAACITETLAVTVKPFREVDERQAWLEGEGERDLAFWRRVHRHFFTLELSEAGLSFDEDILVVCEEFKVVYLP